MSPPRILHVDDDEVHRYTVAKILSRAGYEVVQAETGYKGLEAAKAGPDLIILDVNLPDISGFSVCRKLKSTVDTSSIPILHLSSSRVLSRDKAEGLEFGADAYLTEPVDSGEFLATVKALLRIRESEERSTLLAREWETTFNAISDGVCLVDKNGDITRCNEAMLGFFGKPRAEIVGKKFNVAMTDAFGEAQYTSFLEGPDVGRRRSVEAMFGTQWFRITTDIISDANGVVTGSVHSFSDYSVLKAAEEGRKKVAEELARSNYELNQFAYTVSHDLKEPLRMVSTFVTFLKEHFKGNSDPVAEEYMSFAADGAKRMSLMIDDLLNFSLPGKPGLLIEDVDLNEVVKVACKNLHQLIADNRGEIACEPLPLVRADFVRCVQIFQNLISNAMKFHDPGTSPRLQIRTETHEDHFHVSFADNGIGIQAKGSEKIFSLFGRLHPHTQYPGTGIGLATCRKILESLGGRIWFESQLGVGTTFFIKFPKQPA